jgi:GNAT superfamily N-acetyltransferase
MIDIIIRNEVKSDFREVEILIRKSFFVHPDYQRMGISKKLLEHSFEKAVRDIIYVWWMEATPQQCLQKNWKRGQLLVGRNG